VFVSVDVPTSAAGSLLLVRSPGIIRPRSAGEILDDAWRMVLGDAPLLLALSALFNVPAAVAVLVVLTQARPESLVWRLLLPAAAACLLPLTGLGSGACQEAFRRRAEGKPVGLGGCLGGALGRWLDHVTARALVLAGIVLGLLLLIMPGLAVWAGACAVHPILAAGEARLFGALEGSAREAPRHAGKALAVTLCRLPLLLLATVNLLALAEVWLWVAGNLGGLDTAATEVLLSPSNPAWLVALLLLAWLLLSPFAEACNFLLHVDARARFEGLDLWYRVRQVFPLPEKGRAAAGLLVLGTLLAMAAPARAADPGERLRTLRAVRQDLDGVRQEVEAAKPYPGGNRWAPTLQGLARRLDPAGGPTHGPYRWFYQGIQGFAARDQQSAVEVLTGLGRRLEAAEQSLALQPEAPARGPEAAGPARSKDEIKRAVPQRTDNTPRDKGEAHKVEREQKREVRRPEVRRDDGQGDDGEPAVRSGPGVLPNVPVGGLGYLGWVVLAGLLIAILIVAGLQFFQRRGTAAAATEKPQTGQTAPSLDDVLRQPQPETAAALWRQAEQLAGAGNYPGAVRLLYAAVLAVLHRANLIRYEATRTNGEYLDQLRANSDSPEDVHEPFRRLTGLFELKWYGERACRAEDYQGCRELAERIRGLV
jgi:hypothetical protein